MCRESNSEQRFCPTGFPNFTINTDNTFHHFCLCFTTYLHIPIALFTTFACVSPPTCIYRQHFSSLLAVFITNLTSRLRKTTPTSISIHWATARTLSGLMRYSCRPVASGDCGEQTWAWAWRMVTGRTDTVVYGLTPLPSS